MKIRITLAALFVLAVALTGCMGESVAPTDNAPAAPQGLTLEMQANAPVMLHWQANAESDITGYQICRALVRLGQTSQIAAVTSDPVVTTDYVVPGDAGQWQYYVRAINSAGKVGALSAPVTVTFAYTTDKEAPPDEGKIDR